jgi:hypothetical protein
LNGNPAINLLEFDPWFSVPVSQRVWLCQKQDNDMTIFFYECKNYIPPPYICQEQKNLQMAGRLRGQLRRHRLLPILSTSIPFRDRGLVAQEVDNPREILLLSERKRGRLVSLFTVQVRGARRGCYRNLVPCIDMVFLFYKKHTGLF